MSTPVSTISKTTPVSDTAGPRKTETLPRSGWTSSLSAKIVFIAVVFVLVPVFLYLEFRRAYQESQELLLSSVRAEGRAISQSLLPLLETIDNAALPDLGRHLAPFASEVTTIKLLLRPAGTSARSDAFYYLASWPAVTQSNLQAEHDTLAQQGVLERLGENCSGEMPFSLIYHRPTGGAEIVAAVTPLSTRLGCWAVVASFSEDAFPSAHHRATLLGDAGITDRSAGLSCDGGRYLFDAVQYTRWPAQIRRARASDSRVGTRCGIIRRPDEPARAGLCRRRV
jgi:hypothetical protein